MTDGGTTFIEGWGGLKWPIALLLVAALTACTTTPTPFPPRADVQAIVEPKPKPSPDILTDPAASDRHNAAIEAWGERIHSAGVRLCRFFERTGMSELDCP